MEGLFETRVGAPLAIIGMPDTTRNTLLDPVVVPDALSYLAYASFHAEVKGLNAYPQNLWPPVQLVGALSLRGLLKPVTTFNVVTLKRTSG